MLLEGMAWINRRTMGHPENPRLCRTIDEVDTTLPSHRQTRAHTPGQLRVRYRTLGLLGKGQFGEVYKALDVDAGVLLAVKIIKAPEETLGNMKQLGNSW
jgi:serine/threonine protein kinase